jgi:hypothetical protein
VTIDVGQDAILRGGCRPPLPHSARLSRGTGNVIEGGRRMPWRYNGADNKIEVVVEPDFHGDILALASKRCVWIVDTPGNRLTIDTAWRTGEDLNLCEVSRCNVENPNSRQENLIMIMGMLDDHYPSYEMIVHGLEPGELLTRMLKEEEGFDVSEPTPDGFVALRFPGVRERLIGRAAKEGEHLGE